MADAYARVTGRVGVVTVHQGPGLTNAMTGITEAAKSRTPLLVLAAEAAARCGRTSTIDQAALAAAVGRGRASGVHARASAVADAAARLRTARPASAAPWCSACRWTCRRPRAEPVRLAGAAAGAPAAPAADGGRPRWPQLLAAAERPVFIAGRGARGAPARSWSAGRRACGALLATSAVAKGLFAGEPVEPRRLRRLRHPAGRRADRAAPTSSSAWGCSLNMWTTRHGELIGPDGDGGQVDLDPAALGAHRRSTSASSATWRRAADARAGRPGAAQPPATAPTDVAARIAAEGRWRDVPYEDDGDADDGSTRAR